MFKKCLILLLPLLIMASCNFRSDIDNAPQDKSSVDPQGRVNFSFSGSKRASRAPGNPEDISAVWISVENVSTGAQVYNMHAVNLIDNNGQYISAAVELEPGSYRLTDFIVVDSNSDAVYAAPKEDSEKAYLVENPLPIEFVIQSNNTTNLIPEVILLDDEVTLEDLGYLTFGFEIKENLLKNGGFFETMNPWYQWADNTATNPSVDDNAVATSVIENNELKVTIENSGNNPWSVGVGQRLNIENGVSYEVSFRVRGANFATIMIPDPMDPTMPPMIEEIVPIEIKTQVHRWDNVNNDYTTYSGEQTYILTESNQTVTYTFTMSEATDPEAEFQIMMGGSGTGDVYLDNVIIKRIDASEVEPPVVNNILSNGDFALGIDDWSITNDYTEIIYHPSFVEGALNIDIINGGYEVSELSLNQTGLILETGGTYTLSFDARAENPYTIRTRINTEVQYIDYPGIQGPQVYYEDYNVTQDMQTFTITFSLGPDPIIGDSELNLWIGGPEANGNTIVFDNIVLTKVE